MKKKKSHPIDALTLFGVIVAFFTIFLGQYLEGGKIQTLINGPAFLIVVGGTFGAVLLQTSLSTFKHALEILRWVAYPPDLSIQEAIQKISKWGRYARKKGLLALEDFIDEEPEPFIKKGLEMLIVGCNVIAVRRAMEVELETIEGRDMRAVRVFQSLGGYSPTIGIIGAVLGLIQVMHNLTDPNELGAGIAVAFVATIYGVGLANLIYLPIASKLKSHVEHRVRYNEMVLEGLISIAEGENPRVIETKLQGYLENRHQVVNKKQYSTSKLLGNG